MAYSADLRNKALNYSGLNLNQDKATKPQTVQIVRQGEATPYWFKVNPLYFIKRVIENHFDQTHYQIHYSLKFL